MVGVALALLPLCALGYGADNDTYTVLDAGRSTWQMHLPDTSRNPGYWVFEAIVYALARVGGFGATNLATLAVGMVVLWRVAVLARRMEIAHALLLMLTLAATPVFAIACTSTMDYVWALLGLVLFAECLVAGRFALAVLPGAFAFAVRGADGVVIAGAIAGLVVEEWAREKRLTRRALIAIGTGLAVALLGGLPYVASYRLAGHTFGFTQALAGPAEMWTAKMRVGRFLYKSLYLFGPLAMVVMGLAAVRRERSSEWFLSAYARRAAPVFAGMVLANFVLFFAWPIEISYLLPAAFFGLLLVGRVVAQSRGWAMALLVAVASLNVVTPQLAAPDLPGHATAAKLHPALAQGVLAEDIRLRLVLRGCADFHCYDRCMHPDAPDWQYEAVPQPSR